MAKKKTALPKFKVDMATIGYWARVHDLTLDNILTMDRAAVLGLEDGVEVEFGDPSIDSARGQDKFKEGWDEADQELTFEKAQALIESLKEATGTQ